MPEGPLTDEDYRDLNRAYWNDRAPDHAASSGYGVDRFVAEPDHLSDVVAFDRPRLGDLRGLTGVHLQCHIGTDTISLARLGARMVGLDLSDASVREARELARRTGADARFVEGEVYAAPELLGPELPAGGVDLVYTGVGALCWLPDIRRWAAVVAALLRPGGRLFVREGHPVLWAVDDESTDDELVLRYPYFEEAAPLVWEQDDTYVPVERAFTATRTHQWNHGLGEIVTALLNQGMRLTMLEEHRTVPWDALPGRTEDVGGGEYRLADRSWRLPLTYTLQAVRD